MALIRSVRMSIVIVQGSMLEHVEMNIITRRSRIGMPLICIPLQLHRDPVHLYTPTVPTRSALHSSEHQTSGTSEKFD
jgi:hypothetical protein